MDYTLTGRITPNGDGSFEVDLRGTIDGMEGIAVRKRVAPPTLASRPPEDFQAEVDAIRQGLGEELSRLADDMADMLAEGNKTGKVALSRVLREIYRPFTAAVDSLGHDAMKHGAETALAKGAANVNYAKRAAESYQKPAVMRPTATSGRYDVIGAGE